MPRGNLAPLDPDPREMRALVERVMERLATHHDALPSMPARVHEGGDALALRLRERAAPEHGAALDDLLGTVFDDALSVTFNTASGGYLAYVPGGGLFTAALADLIAGAVNRYTGVWVAAPGLVELEENALAWIASLVGMPETTAGIFTSGGSLANLSAVVAARTAALGSDIADGVLYTSSEAHHSVQKAAHIAGIAPDRVRALPVDNAFRVDPDAVRRALHADRARGLRPFLIVANAGSTNTGAIDPLPALADLARDEGVWFHVDAAYGGFFAMTARGSAALAGMERADSVTLDPHKGLFLPYGTGCLLVRDRAALRAAHDVTGAYMPAYQDAPDRVDYAALSPELSRPFRGLRVWLALKLHGATQFRAALDEKLDLAHTLSVGLTDLGALEVRPPPLSLLTFRVRAPSDARSDRGTAALVDAVSARGRVFMTGTRVGERFLGRACVLHLRTDVDRIQACIDDVKAALAEITAW